MVSESSESPQFDYSKYDLLKPAEAALREGCTEKTIYNRVKQGLYKTDQREDGLYVWVKRVSERLQKPHKLTETVSEITENSFQVTERPSEITEDFQKRLLEITEEFVALSKTVTKLTETVSERDQIITTQNNQLQAAHNALQKRNLPEVIDPRQKEIEELKARLAQMESKPKKPFWKFWGN